MTTIDVLETFTIFSNAKFMFLILLTVCFYRKKSAFNVMSITIICMVLSQVLKFLIKSPLPIAVPITLTLEKWNYIRHSTYSMPSGHAFGVGGFLLSLFVEIKYLIKHQVIRRIIQALLLTILSIICFRLVYFGFHYAIDVVVAIILVIIIIYFYHKLILRDRSMTRYNILILSIIVIGYASSFGILSEDSWNNVRQILLCSLVLFPISHHLKNERNVYKHKTNSLSKQKIVKSLKLQ